MTRRLIAAGLAALIALPLAAVHSQDMDEPPWRAPYDKLLDRFSEVTGDRFAAAVSLFEKHLKEKPDDAAARLELARLLAAKGDAEAASIEAGKVAVASKELASRAEAVRCVATVLGGAAQAEQWKAAHQRLEAAAGSPDAARSLFFAERERHERLRELQVIGRMPPALGKGDLHDKPVDLGPHFGKVILVFFWRSSPDSLALLPEVDKLVKEYEPRGLVVVGVSLDEKRLDLHALLEKHKITWRHIHDARGELARTWHAGFLPLAYLIDHEGLVRFAAKPTAEGLRLTLEKLFERANKKG